MQIRINGRVSSIDQVRALLPETIKRVEWMDNPGLRYGGANYVLNFIVTNPTVGGSLQTLARPALPTSATATRPAKIVNSEQITTRRKRCKLVTWV